MSGDFTYIETSGGDRFNLSNLDYIICPDCGKDRLRKAQLKDLWFCPTCGLGLSESELSEAIISIPDTSQGVGIGEKPYFNQVQAEGKIRAQGQDYPVFNSVDLGEGDNMAILSKYTLKGIAEDELKRTGGVVINDKANRARKPLSEPMKKAIRKLIPLNATEVKIDLT